MSGSLTFRDSLRRNRQLLALKPLCPALETRGLFGCGTGNTRITLVSSLVQGLEVMIFVVALSVEFQISKAIDRGANMNIDAGASPIVPVVDVPEISAGIADIPADVLDEVFELWDDLADFDVADAEGARQCMLRVLCELVGAQNADWIGAVRLEDVSRRDPMSGWRPRSLTILNPDPEITARISHAFSEMDLGNVDPTTTRNAALAGKYRAFLLSDLAPEGWYDGPAYREWYAAIDRNDSIWIGIPVNDDAEIQVGLHRDEFQPPFSRLEATIAGFCLRGLRWFHRLQMVSEGLGVASASLTVTERRVLQGLLQGLSERAIAEENGQSPHTTHDHVKRIFRKYGVSSRVELMALWLGKAPAE